MNEQPGHNVEFFHPEASRLAQRIEKLFFTPQDSMRKDYLNDPERNLIMFTAKSESPDEICDLSVAMYKNSSDGKLPPVLKFPVFSIKVPDTRHSPHNLIATKLGLLPDIVVNSNDDIFVSFNTYYLNPDGQATQSQLIARLKRRKATPWDKITYPQVDFPISEDDSRFVPLAPEDIETISELLRQYETGAFKKGDFYPFMMFTRSF